MNHFIQSSLVFELLYDWSIVKISDVDHKKYLQNHITIDLFNLQYDQHILCAHCNAQGKVNGVLRLFHNDNHCFYIQRSSICNAQLHELNKYAVFENIKIKKLNHYYLLGIMGQYAKEFLLSYFSLLPDSTTTVVFHENLIILWFGYPSERFLFIVQENELLYLKKKLYNHKIPKVQDYWMYFDIISGIPVLERPTFQKFFPKEINLDVLGGINIHKGCYCGQEIISKMYFKNINNKKMYCLFGTSNTAIEIFTVLEVYNGCIWKKIGHVLFSVCVKDNIFLVQCVLSTKNINGNKFRLAIDASSCFHFFMSKEI